MALEDEVRRTYVLLPLTEDYSDVVQSTRLSISLLTRIRRSERSHAQSIIPSLVICYFYMAGGAILLWRSLELVEYVAFGRPLHANPLLMALFWFVPLATTYTLFDIRSHFEGSHKRYTVNFSPTSSDLVDEEARPPLLSLIPMWSIALAGFIVVAVQVQVWAYHPHSGRSPLPLPLRHLFGLFAGLPLALHAIAVGYVSVDCHSRHMKRLTWVLLSAIPGGLGLVFYFLVRRPLLRPCRACSLLCKSGSIFCVHCCCRLQLACERCHLPVDLSDRFCATCGQSQMQVTTK
jgi:hypothetical protein